MYVFTGRGYVSAYPSESSVIVLDEGIQIYDSSTGKLKRSNGSSTIGASDKQGNVVYFDGGASDNTIIAYDLYKQAELWETQIDGNGVIRIKAFDHLIVVYNTDYIYALNIINGETTWKDRHTSSVTPVLLESNLYFMGGFDRIVYAIDMSTGNEVGMLKAEFSQFYMTEDHNLVAEQGLVFFSTGNRLFSYGK